MIIDKRPRAFLAIAVILPLLNACASLPSSGPTGSQIYSASKEPRENEIGFEIVELNSLASVPTAATVDGGLIPPFVPGREQPSDLVGPGDILEIAIYEAGISLFTSAQTPLEASVDAGAKARQLPPIRVDDNGYIRLPYAGRIRAAGHTTTELQRIIEGALAGVSEQPQAMVSLQRSITNSVILYGEVAQAGRHVLATNRETLLDMIALAGGYRGEPSALMVTIERDGQTFKARLDQIQQSSAGNMRIYPGDRISLLREPLTYSVMGAVGRVQQVPFQKPDISLAEAIANSGGAEDNRGDPEAIFVFRFVRDENGAEKPVVYHLNMMRAQAYFLAQKFAMRDEDILYVGNAAANRPSKAVGILSQFFNPIVAARSVSR